ncbi:hypothetical protein CEN39_01825 [Fischerella thermalis CCMEE 5201]|jgi:uncharacterized protein|nr:hypothetical protein CEN39_01825 [Fischerella thermalis CCMEE 5201]
MKLNLLKYKRVFWLSLFSSAILLYPLSSLAVTVQEVPNPRKQNGGWVSDMAGILSNQTEAQINQIISQLEAKNGTEMAVVTVPETAPASSPKKFATELFNNWGIGKKGQDNGVLFLISVGDRRVEIETGYGVEAILPDAKVGNIIDTQIIPRFKQGDFEGGTLAGTKALVIVLEGDKSSSSGQKVTTPNQEPIPNQETTADDTVPWGVLIGGGTAVLAGVSAVFLIRRPRKVEIAPEGRTRYRWGDRIFLCADCRQPMTKVDNTTLQSHLSEPEKVAQKIGSVRFEGWKCPNCSHKLTGIGFHIVGRESGGSKFRRCPICQELTVTRTHKTLFPATQFSSGRRLIIDNCHCCSYHKEQDEIIPRLPPPPPPPPTSHGGGFSGGGGSFGGGSSGGGGAGGSW